MADYVSLQTDPYKSHMLAIRYCGRNQRVLELGCSTGYMSRVLSERGCRIVGIEADAEAAEEARTVCDRVFVGDLERVQLDLEPGSFDVLLCASVLEHLRDPEAVLARLRPLLKAHGRAVIVVPNVANWAMRLGLLFGQFRYRDRGILDRTHLRFFTLGSLKEMIRRAGFQLERADIACPVPFNRSALISRLAHAAGNLRKSLFAYEFVVVATPLPAAEGQVPLSDAERRAAAGR